MLACYHRAPGLSSSGCPDDRPESVVGDARSEGDVNSLGGDSVGGVAIGGAPWSEGIALSNIGGETGRAPGGADLAGGADCALACSGDDNTSAVIGTISQSLTTQSPALDRWTTILGNRRCTECRLHGPFVTS